MAKRGPKRKVSDLRLLLEVFSNRDRAVFASEVASQVDLETTQATRDRLNDIVDDGGYLERETAAGRNLYRLSDAGKKYLLTELRQMVD